VKIDGALQFVIRWNLNRACFLFHWVTTPSTERFSNPINHLALWIPGMYPWVARNPGAGKPIVVQPLPILQEALLLVWNSSLSSRGLVAP